MANFSKVAQEVFEVLRSYDYTVDMFDGDNKRVLEPSDARRFFAKPHNILVSVLDENDDSKINLFYGKSTHASEILGLDNALKSIANKFALIFRAQQYGKEIEPKDIASIAASIVENKEQSMDDLVEKAPPGKKAEHFIKKHKKEFHDRYGKKGDEVLYATAWKKFGESMEIPILEGMYGTSKSSYLKLENAKMIVRHSKKIDETSLGARGRCVEAIFIENALHERHLFPSKQLAPARAMTRHVSNGGSFQDKLGEQIISMAESYAHLGKASRFIKKNDELHESAGQVLEACQNKQKSLRKTFECLYKENTYATEAADILEKSNLLSEKNTIDETRITELRQLLNDADLPREVYECAARAMDECKEEKPMTEITPSMHTESKLAENNKVIKSHMDWLDQFEPTKILEADYWRNTPGWMDDAEQQRDDAEAYAIDHFVPEEFIESDVFQQDIASRYNPDDPEDNHVSKKEIEQALDWFLTKFIETHFIEDGEGYNDDLTDVAKTLYPQVKDLIIQKGFIIDDDNTGLSEDIEDVNEDDLSIGDIVIPNGQKTSLNKEVEPAAVDDPNNPGKKMSADDNYIARMQSLSGIRQGDNYYGDKT